MPPGMLNKLKKMKKEMMEAKEAIEQKEYFGKQAVLQSLCKVHVKLLM